MKLILRLILYPFSLLYGIVMAVRNVFFDIGLLKSKTYDTPVISIGNITVGGTGKTPHTEYIIRLLGENQKLAVLSRGYGRKTKGFLEVNTDSMPINCGDEPCQIKQKFPHVTVAVCEDRREGIRQLLTLGHYDAILLDDAYQHRWVKPNYSILLVDYTRPIFKDLVMPAGRLREFSYGKKRSDCIIVSKCPSHITKEEKQTFIQRLSAQGKTVFFSTFAYTSMQPVFSDCQSTEVNGDILLVTGIANPKPLAQHLRKQKNKVESLNFPDHHHFGNKEIQRIHDAFTAMSGKNKWIITTEKDAVRFRQIKTMPQAIKDHMLYMPIRVELLEKEDDFTKALLTQLNTSV